MQADMGANNAKLMIWFLLHLFNHEDNTFCMFVGYQRKTLFTGHLCRAALRDE